MSRGQGRGRGRGGRGGRGGPRNGYRGKDNRNQGDSRTSRLLGHIAEYLQEDPATTLEDSNPDVDQAPENC